jgi:dipeptidyl aminopeptidase/acylaminoacyl peptidase
MPWSDGARVAAGQSRLPRRAPVVSSWLIFPALVALWATQAVHAVVPLEVYGRLPRLENVALSPDGTRVAFIKTEGDTRVVAVVTLADHQMLRGVRLGEQKVRSIRWADDNRLLIVTSLTGTVRLPYPAVGPDGEWAQMRVFDVRNGSLLMIPNADTFRHVDVVMAVGDVQVRRVRDHTLLFIRGLRYAQDFAPALIRVDLETQESLVLQTGQKGNVGWIVDDAGEVAAEELYDDSDRHWSISIRSGGHMHEAASGHEDNEYPRLLGWGPDANTLLLERIEDGESVWRLLSLKDGNVGPPLSQGQALVRPIMNPRTHWMIGGVHIGDSEEYVFFDPDLQEAWNTLMRSFPGERVQRESVSADLRKVIVRVEGARDGFRYELVDLDAHSAIPLGDVYEGVRQPLDVRRITYAAADGLQIPAYLTLPRGKELKNLPLVVLPHGGPAVRDTADFAWWSQALAAQGYAVLQPNYRGSWLSWRFVSAGFGEWGRKMQTDLSDGVRYLAQQGIADPARVCIVGGSYGGYAALAGPAIDPGTYRCAVAVAGIADLRRFLNWVNAWRLHADNHTQRYLDRFLGVKSPEDPALDAISPIKHLDAITVPVLLIHGKDDTVVPFEQSQLMYESLHKQGKEAQLVVLKGEDHWLSHGSTRLQMLEACVAFLRAHNPPD